MKYQYKRHFDEKQFYSPKLRIWVDDTSANEKHYRYYHQWSKFYRSFHHINVRRDNTALRHDEEYKYYQIYPRMDSDRRYDPWDDWPVRNSGGRSWKQYTRHSKQWMENSYTRNKLAFWKS